MRWRHFGGFHKPLATTFSFAVSSLKMSKHRAETLRLCA
jgi:hypothetical protein